MRLLGSVLFMVLLFSACGGDDDDATNSGADDDPIEQVLNDFGVDTDSEDADPDEDGDLAADGAADSSGSKGTGTVQIGDVTYTVDVDVCFTGPAFFQADGRSSSGDYGESRVEISGSVDEDYDEDGELDTAADITIQYEGNDSSAAAPTVPDLYATVIDFSSSPAGIGEPMFTFTIDGDSMRGSGQIQDLAGVLIPFGETEAVTFEISCTS